MDGGNGMMPIVNLLWIVPLSVAFGILIAALLRAAGRN